MVVLDATVLLAFLFPDASPPIDPATRSAVVRYRDRIEHLLQQLHVDRTPVLLPAPALGEVLLSCGSQRQSLLTAIKSQYGVRVAAFDEPAAIELAMMVDADPKPAKAAGDAPQTYAKLKYDRQIVAIAKVRKASMIYSDDRGLARMAARNRIDVTATHQLLLPPDQPQGSLNL